MLNVYLYIIIKKKKKICKLYKNQFPRPAVSIPKSFNFDEMVAMDLHQLDDYLWYLHFIDEFSRFSNGIVIKRKQSNIFIQQFFYTKHWIIIFGTPVSVFSDNGDEFVSSSILK